MEQIFTGTSSTVGKKGGQFMGKIISFTKAETGSAVCELDLGGI
jgi:hypothetical protein